MARWADLRSATFTSHPVPFGSGLLVAVAPLGGLVLCVLALGANDRDILSRATRAAIDATMRAALGDDFLRGVSSDRRARLRPTPIVFFDLFLGIDAGEARVSRNIPFAAPEGARLTLDIYRPVSAGRYPSVVQV